MGQFFQTGASTRFVKFFPQFLGTRQKREEHKEGIDKRHRDQQC